MAADLNMTVAESTWVVNAYALTLASTLLTVRSRRRVAHPVSTFFLTRFLSSFRSDF